MEFLWHRQLETKRYRLSALFSLNTQVLTLLKVVSILIAVVP